jgi:two-component system NtrC family response regulator
MTPANQDRRLLIIEDDADVGSRLKQCFDGYAAVVVGRDAAMIALRQQEPQVVLAAGMVPGFETLRRILELAPATKVIVLTDSHDRQCAVKAVAAGAWDFCERPVDAEVLRMLVDRAFQIAALEQRMERLHGSSALEGFEGMIAVDRAMQGVCRTIEKIAPAQVSVLILGESGTGKELLARAIHNRSGRASKRFIAVNCAAIPEPLLEAELFGHESPAAPGSPVPGKIEQAHGGTLFLEEVGDLPLALQARLLRFLQNKAIERTADRGEISVDVRVVAAASRSLEARIQEQRFRHDLSLRLGEVVVNVPPLRERPGDILPIAQATLVRHSRSQGLPRRGFTDDAAQMLTVHNWPGNVRELENKVKVACLLGDDPLITAGDLGLASGAGIGLPLNLKEVRNRAERDAVSRAMAASTANISRAAEMLGVSRPTLYDLLARHELGPADRRESTGIHVAGGAA